MNSQPVTSTESALEAARAAAEKALTDAIEITLSAEGMLLPVEVRSEMVQCARASVVATENALRAYRVATYL